MIDPYLESGAVMGLSPAAVRAAGMADFAAMVCGWNRAHGGEGDGLSDDDRDDLIARLRRADAHG